MDPLGTLMEHAVGRLHDEQFATPDRPEQERRRARLGEGVVRARHPRRRRTRRTPRLGLRRVVEALFG